jgi:MFS family permease
VYESNSAPVELPPLRWAAPGRAWRSVAPNVWFLGATSLLTDVSSEMVASVLPVYLVLHLNLSPLAFGALDGLYNGVTAIVRWASGVFGDRSGRHKEIAAAGYALSAASRLGLLGAGRALPGLAAAIAADRLGKGIRTVPRDALISLSGAPNRLGYSFGVHRALDATGALLGPLVALALLGLVPNGYDVVFVTSFCVAVVGLGVLLLFVENVPAVGAASRPGQATLGAAIQLLSAGHFRTIVITASVLALFTISDAFIYLVLQRSSDYSPGLFPMLYAGTSSSYLLLAVPSGRLADRLGRPRMFLLGHGALLAVYVLLLVPAAGVPRAFLAVILLGAYYAATDGVLMAVAGAMLPPGLRGSGFALLTTATSLARFAASIAFGWVWTTWDAPIAVVSFVIPLACTIPIAVVVLRRTMRDSDG